MPGGIRSWGGTGSRKSEEPPRRMSARRRVSISASLVVNDEQLCSHDGIWITVTWIAVEGRRVKLIESQARQPASSTPRLGLSPGNRRQFASCFGKCDLAALRLDIVDHVLREQYREQFELNRETD